MSMKRTDEPQQRMSVGHIYIEKDGWVWVETRDGKHQLGLGDLGVDVFIHDMRELTHNEEENTSGRD